MKKYKILEHRADLKMQVFGKDLAELFSNAVLALSDVLKHNTNHAKADANSANRRVKLKIKAADANSLLVDFLNEILTQSQTDRRLYKVSSLKLRDDKTGLEAELVGCAIDRFDEDIKAATYHDLELKKVDGEWSAIILFDI